MLRQDQLSGYSLQERCYCLENDEERMMENDVLNERLERNKKTAMAFYSMAFNDCKPNEAVEKYAGNEYMQHNPLVGEGKAAFISYFKEMAEKWPGKKVNFIRAIAEGNYVVLHCHQEWPGDHEYAGVDIFRLDENGKIVEHWDVLQVVPENARNENTMF